LDRLRPGGKPHDFGQKKRFCPLELGKLRQEALEDRKLKERLYTRLQGVREIAKFATQKAAPPATDSMEAFLQISLGWIIFFPFLFYLFMKSE
jgi:predicted aminopeptidase